ncbi:hypothetical protein DFH27DRAFT_534793 [Peziza echinospora]|nr:hypothetical protein DFH27DRAFT_534793 [Peziza echinospora]
MTSLAHPTMPSGPRPPAAGEAAEERETVPAAASSALPGAAPRTIVTRSTTKTLKKPSTQVKEHKSSSSWEPPASLRNRIVADGVPPLFSQTQQPRARKLQAIERVANVMEEMMNTTPNGRHLDSLTGSSSATMSAIVMSRSNPTSTQPEDFWIRRQSSP